MEKIKLLHDYVLIEREPAKQGVIFNPNPDHTGIGTVLETGPGTDRSPMTVSKGDRVRWDHLYHAGFDLDETRVLVHCCDLEAIL